MNRVVLVPLLAALSCSPGDWNSVDQRTGDNPDKSEMADMMDRPGPPPMGGALKLPHVVVAATGEDLGILLDLKTLTFYSEKAGAPIALGLSTAGGITPATTPIGWDQADCKGRPYVSSVATPGDIPRLANLFFLMAPDGEFGRSAGSPRSVAIRSIGASMQCTNISLQVASNQYDFVGSGVRLRRFTDSELKIELR